MIDRNVMLDKLIQMFRPHGPGKFLDYKGRDVVCGPNDRAMIGCDTNFPKRWLVEDFDFTPEEADWFVAEVHRLEVVEK